MNAQTTELVNLDEVSAGDMTPASKQLRQDVADCRRNVEDAYWRLSQLLFKVYDESTYREWGYATWREYVEQELEFGMRKAQYLVSIAEWVKGLSDDVQNWVATLGWTKAKELTGKVTNANATEWKKKVEGKTVAEIQAALKSSGENEEEDDKPKKNRGDRPHKLSFSLFPEQSDNVSAALTKAEELSGSGKPGHNLDMICLDYMTTNGTTLDTSDYLKRIESQVGLRLLAFDPKGDDGKGAVVFGEEIIQELAYEYEEVGEADD